MLGSTPVHTCSRWSYLSSERQWRENHTGLYNLAAVVLVATNFRSVACCRRAFCWLPLYLCSTLEWVAERLQSGGPLGVPCTC